MKNDCGMHEMMNTPTQIHQFLIKLNDEALQKVSSIKLHSFLKIKTRYVFIEKLHPCIKFYTT